MNIVENTGLSRQIVHVTIKKFEEWGLVERIKRKIFKKSVKIDNTRNVENALKRVPKLNQSFHHLSFKIPVTKYSNSFFERFKWSIPSWKMRGQRVYYFEDNIKKNDLGLELRKKYDSQKVFVKFYVRLKDGNCKMHVGFKKVDYNEKISPKEGINDFQKIAYSYMKRFIADYAKGMELDANKLIKTKTGHFKMFDLPEEYDNLRYEDDRQIIDNSEDIKPEYELKFLDDAEFWHDFPQGFSELQEYIDRSYKKQKQLIFKLMYSVNNRFEEILNLLEMNNTEMKMHHEMRLKLVI